jgi:protein-disulfide isomerase
MAVHAINLALLVTTWFLAGQGGATHRSAAWKFVLIIPAALLGASVESMLFHPDDALHNALAEFDASPGLTIPASDGDATLGPVGAPVEMVVFSSFQCPACKSFAGYLRDVHRLYGDRVRIVFKNYPLSTQCNHALSADMQPRACAAAYAAEAARRQNAFWPFHDRLFASSLLASEDILQNAARTSGLDVAKWDLDRNSSDVRLKVMADAAFGKLLGIEGTPSIFINGRKAVTPNRLLLSVLITREIRAAGKRKNPASVQSAAAR